MIQENDLSKIQAPSKKALAKATVIALAIALLVLFAAVLPAEYGIDPLHTGAALGLTELAGSTNTPDAPSGTPAEPGQPTGAFTAQPTSYRVDTQELSLHAGDGVEIKYHMPKGATIVYSWKATGKVMFEFHGEPDQKPNPDYYDSYELDDKVGKDRSHGSFTAPSTGIHGWFWENKSENNVEVRLTVAGFFDGVKMFAGGPPEELPLPDPQ